MHINTKCDYSIRFFEGDQNNVNNIKPKKANGVLNICFPKNKGLSKAANYASKLATKDYICLIDDDMEMTTHWDMHLLNAHERTRSNWVSSTMVEPIPSKTNISTYHKYNPFEHGWWRQNSNCPLLIPKDFWDKIGGYDEDFPNVGAELGLAKRAYDNGVRDFVQTPFSVIIHHQSQSMNRIKGLPGLRKARDRMFKDKYGITRKEFVSLIKKGERYDPTF
jgi:GT2 family glycosyltransferase